MLKIAPQLSWPPVEGELAVFDGRDGRYHVLNPSAAAIWRGLADGAEAPQLAETLAEEHAVPVAQVRADIDAFIASALDAGLLVREAEA